MSAAHTEPELPTGDLRPVANALSILNAAADAIVSLDSDGRIEFANSRACQLLGGDPDADLLGRPIRTYIPFLGSSAAESPNAGWELGGIVLLATGRETAWTDDGATLSIEYEASPLRSGRRCVGAVLSFREIGQRQAAERAKDEVIAIVSHELRSPLTAIRASIGLAASGQVGKLPDAAQRMMSIALANTDRLLRLINELLDLERLNSGAAPLATGDHDAGQLMQQATDGIRLLAEQSKVTINVVSTHLRVWCDADRMVQVLTNLLANAIKFSPSGSSIWLQAEVAPEEVIFRVRDQGRGIPASKLETIFDPFSQIEEGDARAKGGSGLGLAISRSIVTQHGGHIWAESAIGSGTTIFVAIPHRTEAMDAEAA